MRLVLLCLFALGAFVGDLRAQRPLSLLDRPFPCDQLVAPGDLDGDGDLDGLAWTDGFFDGRVLINDGAASFSAHVCSGLAWPAVIPATAFYVADFNGDGFGDVLMTGFGNPYAAVSTLWFGGPGYAFTPGPPLPTTGSNPWLYLLDVKSYAVADVDLDGDLDVVVGVSNGASLPAPPELWLNDGTGAFTSVSAGALTGSTAPHQRVVVRDANADGLPDVALFGSGSMTKLYLNVLGTTFVQAPAPPFVVPLTGTLGDFDGDGFADWAYVESSLTGTTVRAAFGSALGFAPPVGAGYFGSYPSVPGFEPPVPLDVDGDGADELLVRVSGATPTLVLLDATPTLGVVATSESFAGFAAISGRGDFDGDGDVDLVRSEAGLLMNDGVGSCYPRPDYSAVPEAFFGAYPPICADFSGDGVADYLGAPSGYAPSTLLRLATSDGGGGLALSPSGDVLGQPNWGVAEFRRAAAADFDGDLDVDLYVAARDLTPPGTWTQDFLYPNLGGGVFGTPVALVPAGNSAANLAVACDVDLDGDEDVVVAVRSGSPPLLTVPQLLLNVGGTLAAPVAFGTAHPTRDLMVGDFDGDGDRDVVLVGTTGVANGWTRLMASGPGGATAVVVFAPAADFAGSGDLNGDGAQDLVLGAYVRYGGTGLLAVGPFLPTPLVAPATLVDLDEDGDLDLVEAPATVMRNLGGGIFSMPESILPRAVPSASAFLRRPSVSDLDRDGDLDLLAPGPRAFLNVTRHLAHVAPPRLGRPSGVRLFGMPGGTAHLFAAPLTASLPLPPYGTVLLDPFTAVGIASGTFAPATAANSGEATLPFFVPNTPSLAGLTLHWQAVDVGTAAFTNRLTSMVAAF